MREKCFFHVNWLLGGGGKASEGLGKGTLWPLVTSSQHFPLTLLWPLHSIHSSKVKFCFTSRIPCPEELGLCLSTYYVFSSATCRDKSAV